MTVEVISVSGDYVYDLTVDDKDAQIHADKLLSVEEITQIIKEKKLDYMADNDTVEILS